MTSPQEEVEATVMFLLDKFTFGRSKEYTDEEWILYERYSRQVLALAHYQQVTNGFKGLETKSAFCKAAFKAAFKYHIVRYLYVSMVVLFCVCLTSCYLSAIHDNDTTRVAPIFLETATESYCKLPEKDQDPILWAFLRSQNDLYHLSTSEFVRSEGEMRECLRIRCELLDHDDLLVSMAHRYLALPLGSQERFEEDLDLLLKAGKILEVPAGDAPGRKLIWKFNTSWNYYCMERYEEAESLLRSALADAKKLQSWYMQVHANLAYASLHTRLRSLDVAKHHVNTAARILETSGSAARFSWIGSYCAFRAGVVASKQHRQQDATTEHEKSVAIGRLTKLLRGMLCRSIHALSQSLAKDQSRAEEAERLRLEARKLRGELPGDSGDLDDESDEAFERLVKIDRR